MEKYIDNFRNISIIETIKELSDIGYSVHKYNGCFSIFDVVEPLSCLMELSGALNHLSQIHEKDDIDLEDYLEMFANPKLVGNILYWPEVVWPEGFKL